MELGKTLRRLRTRSGLTQQEVSDRLNVSRVAIGQWESDRTMPRKGNLEQLADLFGVTVSELMGDSGPAPMRVRPSSVMVPLVGSTHMGAAMDEETCDREVEVPASVVERHPQGYCVHAEGGCMDRRYPPDSVLYIDTAREPCNGCAVLAELPDYRSVVRVYMRGGSTLMLSPDSLSGEYEDIIVRPDDGPVSIKGVVVWYQAEDDLR